VKSNLELKLFKMLKIVKFLLLLKFETIIEKSRDILVSETNFVVQFVKIRVNVRH